MRAAPFALLILSAALVSAQDARIVEVGKSPVEAKVTSGSLLRMNLCSSGIDVIDRDENVLRVSYHADRDDAQHDVRVRIQISGDRADLRVSGCPRNNFRVTIEVPKNSGLYVRMFAGELNVRNVTGDKNVELDFGQLTMDLGNPDQYAHVGASVNSGEVNAIAFNVSKGGLFRSFSRSGPGKYRVHAHVGAGEVDLR